MQVLFKVVFAICFAAGCCSSSLAQVATLTPLKVQAGQTLTITYSPKVSGAKLTRGEDIYAIGKIYLPENQSFVLKMHRLGEVYQCDFKVPAEVGYLSFFFLSVNASDREQKIGRMIYRPDGQPVRDANLGKMLSEDLSPAEAQTLFEQEIKLYPDHFAAYISKWELLRRRKTTDWQAQIKKDLELIEQQAQGQGVEYLCVQAFNAMQTMAADKLISVAERMLKEYPDSPWSWQVLDRVVAGAHFGMFKGELPKSFELKQWERLQQHPAALVARERLQDFAWNADALNDRKTFPLVALEQIANHWITVEPDNPFPYDYLSRIYLDRQEKLAEALPLSEKALALYQANKQRLFMNNGKIIETQSLLYDALLTSAALHWRLQKLSDAYIRVKAAQTLKQESAFKSTETKSYLLEGRILQAQNSLTLAERAYLTAWLNGADEAESGLRAIHEKRGNSPAEFAGYLRQKRDQLASNETIPEFNVTSLTGQKLNSAALKGKIVVLNFWYLGCAPCLAEIPGLNQLVAEFKNKDVVFIAFAQDQEKELREFLQKKPFDYQIIANAETLHQQFQLNLWPTHIILNRAGKVAQRLTGGGLNRHEELRRLISRVLY